MFQAVEYSVRDYLLWLQRVTDFNTVEKRKSLVKTSKAQFLLISGWCLFLLLWILAFSLLFMTTGILKYLWFILAIIILPYIFSYLLILPLWLIKAAQKPIEYFIIRRAKKILSQHKALKIAIAGSYGKTTMREILKTVLSAKKKTAAPPGSYNTPLGISTFISELKGDEEILIFELGEYYPGDIMKLCRFVKPDIGVITGVNEAHLQKFKTLEKTAQTIFELSDWLGEKILYLNAEDAIVKKYAKTNSVFYSREGAGLNKVQRASADISGLDFTVQSARGELRLKSSLLGLHQIGPILVAIDMAIGLDMDIAEIERVVLAIKPFEHRLEPKTDSNGVITLDDSYNGNPSGVKVIIEFLAGLKNHRRWYVSPGLVEMGSRSKEVHIDIGRQLALAGIEKVVLMRNSVTPFIAEGLEQNAYQGEIVWFDDPLKAYEALPHMTLRGDIVVLQNDWPDQYA